MQYVGAAPQTTSYPNTERMMDERDATNPQATSAGAEHPHVASAPVATKRRRPWGPILFGVFILLPVLLIMAWTAISLNWTYSSGDRAGYIQKFSRKGWLCKTWEGELAMVNVPGAMQERFEFSVRNDSVAHEITKLMGSRVSLTYEEHRGVPTRCFGETNYFVTAVRAMPATP